jgi:hypothetical protein
MKRNFDIHHHHKVDALLNAERARLQDIHLLATANSYGGRGSSMDRNFSIGLGSEQVEPVQEVKPTKLAWLSTFIGKLAEAATCALVVLGVLFVIIEVIL